VLFVTTTWRSGMCANPNFKLSLMNRQRSAFSVNFACFLVWSVFMHYWNVFDFVILCCVLYRKMIPLYALFHSHSHLSRKNCGKAIPFHNIYQFIFTLSVKKVLTKLLEFVNSSDQLSDILKVSLSSSYSVHFFTSLVHMINMHLLEGSV
jgi:hypothetical protein